MGIPLATYRAYESESWPLAIPEHITRLIELGAFRAFGLIDENLNVRKSKLQEEFDVWNVFIEGAKTSEG